LYFAVCKGEYRIVAAQTNSFTGVEFRADLPDDDVSRTNFLTAENLHPAPLSV
jgi:hypothetical protein